MRVRGQPWRKWALAGAVLVIFSLGTAEAVSALTVAPEFCTSCHPMDVAYITWEHSGHREVADCNACHLDQRNWITRLYSKGTTGLGHLYRYQMGQWPVHIGLLDTEMVQANCQRCHGELARNLALGQGEYCFDCHRYTPHGNFR